MHLFVADPTHQLASDRQRRLLAEARRHRLRRRPVGDLLPGSPPDAA